MPLGGALSNLESRIYELERFKAPNLQAAPLQSFFWRGKENGDLVPNWNWQTKPFLDWPILYDGFLLVNLWAGDFDTSGRPANTPNTVTCIKILLNGTMLTFAEHLDTTQFEFAANSVMTPVKQGDIISYGNGKHRNNPYPLEVPGYTASPNYWLNWLSMQVFPSS